MARKPVERLRPSARLQAVARPVETYVRPAEQPEARTGLGEFISAIAPAAQPMAEILFPHILAPEYSWQIQEQTAMKSWGTTSAQI